MSQDEIVSLLVAHQDVTCRYSHLEQKFEELRRQLDSLKRQLFGSKSERRVLRDEAHQLTLGELPPADATVDVTVDVPAHARRPKGDAAGDDDGDLRFDESVPVERIDLPAEIPAAEQADYQQIGEKRTLAQRPGSYVILEYVRPVMKKKAAVDAIEDEIVCASAPASVLDRSVADVSLLAGLLVDKFLYHLPLYRQHQRMAACGVRISRGSLTNWVHRSAELLAPIDEALRTSILLSTVLAMDETPIRAGRKKGKPPDRGKMATGYFWPMYGDGDEVCFHFAPTRSHSVVPSLLRDFSGTLVTDGYEAYAKYASQRSAVRHAACWVHTRRGFEKALDSDGGLADAALARIGELYAAEAALKGKSSQPEKVLAWRAQQSKPVVEDFFAWLRMLETEQALLPSSPFAKARAYALEREEGLKVFLEDPAVPLDTNHLEREIRPVAVGRRNWLFCWTEDRKSTRLNSSHYS